MQGIYYVMRIQKNVSRLIKTFFVKYLHEQFGDQILFQLNFHIYIFLIYVKH